MDSTVSPRFATSLLALLFCVVASLRAGDVKPARMVTEVVSVAMVNARQATLAPPADPAAGVLHLAASGSGNGAADPIGPMSPDRWQPLTVPAVPAHRPAAVAQRSAAPQPAPCKPVARGSTQVARATPAAKSRGAGKGRPRTQRPPVLAAAKPAAPEVPAVFAPLRQLGLSIQAKLPATPAGAPAATKPPQPGGPTQV